MGFGQIQSPFKNSTGNILFSIESSVQTEPVMLSDIPHAEAHSGKRARPPEVLSHLNRASEVDDSKKPVQLRSRGILNQTGKKQKVPVPVRERKGVHFNTRPVPSPTIGSLLLDLGRNQDFCTQILCPSLLQNNCLGYLEIDRKYKHIFYAATDRSSDGFTCKTSLTDVLNQLATPGAGFRISKLERLSLETSLAKAALQFQGTPWMQNDSLGSSDIWFFSSRNERNISLGNPYVGAIMKSSHERPTRAATVTRGHLCVRNRLLFCLAVLLIEIAMGAPLCRLRHVCDHFEDRDEIWSDWSTAVRLSSAVGTRLGKTYQNVVEKCLYSFPGVESDISKQSLQLAFYSDVVTELETLEQGLRRLQLGDQSQTTCSSSNMLGTFHR